jgi:small-conductance mechanosensitive channel
MQDNDLQSWAEAVQTGVGEAIRKVAAALPEVLAALVVLLIGVVVAYVLKQVVVRLLKAVNLKDVANKAGWNQVFQGKYDVIDLLGDFVKWFFIVVFLLQALAILGIDEVSDLVGDLLGYIPNVLAAAAVVFVGFVVADLTARVVANAARAMGASTSRLMANIARWSIGVVVVFTALAQLGVNTLFLERVFTGIVVALALASGLAFGLGGRDAAKDVIDNFRSGLGRD